MIVQPKIRGFICTTAHPVGCDQNIQEQVDYVKSQGKIKGGPKTVLVVGSSTGYGLSSRIVSAFGCDAATIGVFFEKSAEEKRTATAGWYNSVAFEKKAHAAGLYAKSFNGDAFSDEMRKEVIETIKKDLKGIDLVVYSLASPRRKHPRTEVLQKSVLKPINGDYTEKSIDLDKLELEKVTLHAASEEEIENTIAVMGGEDWKFWIESLLDEGLLNEGALTVAYSYVGPELTRAVYRNGTIGRAKDHLENTAFELTEKLKSLNGRALVSVNKALVTQSSSAIPFIPLYFTLLKKVMKEKGIEENCIEQMDRLFRDRLYSSKEILVDDKGLVRVDDFEMREDVQVRVQEAWDKLTEENISQYADLDGYRADFIKLFGFGVDGVDYNADVEHNLSLPSSKLK